MSSTLHLSHSYARLPSSRLDRLCDFCVCKGWRYMVLANGNAFSLYASPSDAKEDAYMLQQIIDNPFSKSDFTKVCWAKSAKSGVSENGELYLAFDSIVAIYAPQSTLTVSGGLGSFRVAAIWILHCSGVVAVWLPPVLRSRICASAQTPLFW